MVNIVVIIIEIVGTGRRDLRYVLKLLKNLMKLVSLAKFRRKNND